MMQIFSKNNLYLICFLIFLMFLTRGSHFLTAFSIPDASLIIFLCLGLLIPSILLFCIFFILAAVIDFGSGFFDNSLAFCLTDGYWGLIPTYLVMFCAGKLIKNYDFKYNTFFVVVFVSITLAFIISTNTYYMFSDRFGSPSFFTSIQHGWNYFPAYLIPNLVYGSIVYSLYQLDLKNYFLKFIQRS